MSTNPAFTVRHLIQELQKFDLDADVATVDALSGVEAGLGVNVDLVRYDPEQPLNWRWNDGPVVHVPACEARMVTAVVIR